MRRALLTLSLVVSAGCVPEAQLSPDVLIRLQRDARVEIYDRENDLAIARGRADDVLVRKEQVRRQLDELEGFTKQVKARLAKNENGAEQAAAYGRTLAAKRAFLIVQLRQLDAALDAAEAQAAAARARLEQTRQRQLVITGRAVQASLDRFDKAVELSDKRVRDAERREADARLEAERAFSNWKASEAEYAKSTGDYDTGIWID